MIGATTGLILSNVASSLQPTIVKLSQLNSYDQTILRILIFAISCVILTKWFRYSDRWIRASFRPEGLGMNVVNILSVYAGIHGFQMLPVGVGLTVFYTFPIYLTLLSQWERQREHHELTEENQSRLWYGIGISFLGLLLIFAPDWLTFFRETPQWTETWRGFAWVSISAMTHAFTIYYYHKMHPDRDSAPARLGSLTLPTALAIVALSVWNPGKWALGNVWEGSDDAFRWQVLLLAIFQATVGLGGFLLHFYSIPKLPKEWISSLSFLILVGGYLFGWFFFGEALNWRMGAGTVLVVIGIAVVSRALKGEFEGFQELHKEREETKRFLYDKLKLIALS